MGKVAQQGWGCVWNVKNKKSTSAASLPGNPEMLLRFAGRKSKQHLRVPKWEKWPNRGGDPKRATWPHHAKDHGGCLASKKAEDAKDLAVARREVTVQTKVT
jgi:hypothetical protein